MSSLTLPKSGGMRNGQLYQRPPLEPVIAESASSSLPTPTARDYKDTTLQPAKHRPLDTDTLNRAIAHLLPTPRAQNGEERNMNIYARPLNQPQNLENALALLPTPTVNDMGAGKDPQKWQEWTEEMRQKHGNGNGHGRSLEQEAVALLPTPTAQAAKHLLDDRGLGTPDDCNLWSVAGRLLPTPRAQEPGSTTVGYGKNLIEVVTGRPQNGDNTSQPSDDGNTSSDDQHQTPQLWEQQADPG
jgi:hypothetical protein